MGSKQMKALKPSVRDFLVDYLLSMHPPICAFSEEDKTNIRFHQKRLRSCFKEPYREDLHLVHNSYLGFVDKLTGPNLTPEDIDKRERFVRQVLAKEILAVKPMLQNCRKSPTINNQLDLFNALKLILNEDIFEEDHIWQIVQYTSEPHKFSKDVSKSIKNSNTPLGKKLRNNADE